MASKSKHSQASRVEESLDEAKYRKKYQELKRKVREIEKFNEELVIKICRVKKNVRRTKIERNLLFDRLEHVKGESDHESDAETGESEIEHVDKPAPKKVEKDPNAPKRPSNAFFIFCQLERSKLKEIHQDASLSELTKMLGQRWKVMTMEEKKKYYDISAKDKVRYEREMCTYNGTVYQPSADTKETLESPIPAIPTHSSEGITSGAVSATEEATELETMDSRVESESNVTMSDHDA
ncbi:HMG-box [Basidiobolus meristosporus CBS 931.73]|uniref:HMG-box n=1 Tax=Basidiobolus meristosporus CBS 931.73 TaxID=1314790 RepID=A0A1Y1Z550_9FUNG|nr:HMG-box [Basidiobolus meristosporus CBS 931.73]|eukprot:ORY05336.1 HMG-box [Basidiobolus meristosporus CBS 931.73]